MPTIGRNPLLKLAAFLAGLSLAWGAAWLGHSLARADLAALAQANLAGVGQGMRVWTYDNPFLAGKPLVSTAPPPRLHKPFKEKGHREYPFSWRWAGVLQAPVSGEYLITVYAAESVRLWLDGQTRIERWVASPPRTLSVLAFLSKGPHLLDLANVQETRRLDLSLLWAPPGQTQRTPLPKGAVRPLAEGLKPAQLDQAYGRLRFWRGALWALPLCWLALWWLLLSRPGRAWRAVKEHRWLVVILALAGVSRLAWAATAPGISGESAFFVWRAELILEGAWPWLGMNSRVGPTFDYLLALPTLIFGPGPWVLRATGSLLNLLALVFCHRVLLREAGKPAALAGTALVATAPFVVAFARVPVEYCALLPLALFAGADLFSLARQKPHLAWWAGIIWGLAMFTHPVFVMAPAAAGGAAALLTRFRVLKQAWFWAGAWGCLVGFAPRLVTRWLFPAPDPMSFTDPARILHLPAFVDAFAKTLDGSLVYQLYTGAETLPPLFLLPLALTLGAVWLAWRWWKGHGPVPAARRDPAVFCLLALVLMLLATPVGAPSVNPRYFLLSGLAGLAFLATVFGLAWESAGRERRRVLAGGLALLLCANLVYLGVNYFHSHLKSGGRTLAWEDPWLDHTPDAWMNHRDLADWLAQKPWPVVATADWWHHTLHLALNLYRGPEKSFQAVDMATDSRTDRAAVFYNSWQGREMAARFFGSHAWKTYEPVQLPPRLAKRYLVYQRVAPPVPYPPDLEPKP